MSPKYDKSVEVSREEEGSYHRVEIENAPRNYSTTDYQVVKSPSSWSSRRGAKTELASAGYTSDEDNFEEWTTSKRKVNHTTRQVETRVTRQLLVEDGKVIADSGPQVTTRIKEDNKVEECEKEKTPKNKGKFDAIESAPEVGESSGRVLGEKKEIQRVSREVREENMQYHDERFKELTGHDVHRRAIKAPHELITITDKSSSLSQPPKGKMVHYSNKGKKYQDTDEILEVAKLAIDGSITKEVKRTRHHEECSEDEKPDETGEAEALREAPTVTRSSRRHVDYVNDFDDLATPSCSSGDEQETVTQSSSKKQHTKSAHKSSSRRAHSREQEDEAFPRYQIDPLLNSLRDEDFRPLSAASGASEPSRSRHAKQHKLERKNYDSSSQSDDDQYRRSSAARAQHHISTSTSRLDSPSASPAPTPVEVPEEYRVNKQKLMGSKGSRLGATRERTVSPTGAGKHQQTQPMTRYDGKSAKLNRNPSTRNEDAGVQAHLTDEEDIERKSMRSSSSGGLNSHQRATQHLQRQSTANSSRRYYYGDGHKSSTQRARASSSSSSASSLGDPKERMRQQGVRSRDSGYKEPSRRIMRTDTPSSQHSNNQIYSVSSKSKKNRNHMDRDEARGRGVASPTPTSASVGQRSVKTTTTTLSADLEDRPLSRQERSASSASGKLRSKSDEQARSREAKKFLDRNNHHYAIPEGQDFIRTRPRAEKKRQRVADEDFAIRVRDQASDTISISSLGAAATTIKVPYRQTVKHNEIVTEPRRNETSRRRQREPDQLLDSNRVQSSDVKQAGGQVIKVGNILSKPSAHFDHKTIVANVQASSYVPKPQTIEAYNVRVIKHNSPFQDQLETVSSVSDLSRSIARLEKLSSALSSSKFIAAPKATSTIELQQDGRRQADKNNNPNFEVAQSTGNLLTINNNNNNNNSRKVEKPKLTGQDFDGLSTVSSSSLRSSKTYDIKSADLVQEEDLDDESDFPVEKVDTGGSQDLLDCSSNVDQDEHRPAAWIFDLKDGTSTTIEAPPKPAKPELPKVDSKELAKSLGGESYYLELIESGKEASKKNRPSSIDSLYSRSNSHSSISGGQTSVIPRMHQKSLAKSSVQLSSAKQTRQSRQPAQAARQASQRARSSSNMRQSTSEISGTGVRSPSGSWMSKSKSSFCLASSTRPTKYSIYGGLRKPDEPNKPVPRLSYSRAIGPKSQRQTSALSKTPSRYLKMK